MQTPIWLNSWRMTWYPRMLIVGVVAGLLIAVLCGKGAETLTGGRLGGDFPAFYGAGRTVAEGRFDDLYNFRHEAGVQKGLIPGNDAAEMAMPFPYPPFVALAYYPATLLGYRLSFLVHALLMMLLLTVSSWILSRHIGYFQNYLALLFCILLFYYPMLRSEIGRAHV